MALIATLVLARPTPLLAQQVTRDALVGSWVEKDDSMSVLTLRADSTVFHKGALRAPQPGGARYDVDGRWQLAGDTLVISITRTPTGTRIANKQPRRLVSLKDGQLTLTNPDPNASPAFRVYQRADSAKAFRVNDQPKQPKP